MKVIGLLLCLGGLLWAHDPVCQQAFVYQLIGDHARAVALVEEGLQNRTTPERWQGWVEAIAKQGEEERAIAALRFVQEEELAPVESNLIEEVAWAVIEAGSRASSLSVRLNALIGAALTDDTRAIPVVCMALRSQSTLLREVGVELATRLKGASLEGEVKRLLHSDPSWRVRLGAIRAVGSLQLQEVSLSLQEVIGSDRSRPQEKQAAITSLLEMTENISPENLEALAGSSRAGLRELMAAIVAEFGSDDNLRFVVPLLSDTRPDVRRMALTALGLKQQSCVEGQDVVALIEPLLDDLDQSVAITATWVLTFLDSDEGMTRFRSLLADPQVKTQRLAAAALRATGPYGLNLSLESAFSHADPYVRMNLAIGLIEQRVRVDEAAASLYREFEAQSERWMWRTSDHPLFRVLQPSTIRINGRVPNYPEVVNQLTRLEVLNFLAMVEFEQAEEAVKRFLSGRSWGISGLAAMTLLEEGSPAALDLVRTLLNDPDAKIRTQAALALATWGKDPAAIEVLEAVYPEADRDLKMKVLESLGHIGSQESVPFLLQTLQEPFQTLRIIAASSLIKCLNN